VFQPIVANPVFVPVVNAVPPRPADVRDTQQTLRSAASPNSETGRREAANERANQGQGGREEEISDVIRRGAPFGTTQRGLTLDISV